jgi:hypothetical protein
MKIDDLVVTYVKYLYCFRDGRRMLMVYSKNLKKQKQEDENPAVQFYRNEKPLNHSRKFYANPKKKILTILISIFQTGKAIPRSTHF